MVASGLPAFVHVAGEAARFVPPKDSAGLGFTVASLLEDEQERQRLSDRALERALRFDSAAVGEQYIEAYELALERSA